ncbi:MAG: Thiamine biosynthesis lipoprotein ApbE precursor [Planctomycetota bacterium]
MAVEPTQPTPRRVGLLRVALWGCAALAACAPAPTVHSFGGATMGTTYSVQVVTDGASARGSDIASTQAAVDALLVDVNARFSTYQSDSLISRLNRAPADVSFPVDEEFLDVLGLALQIADASGGAYDPTVEPLVRLLGFGPESDGDPLSEADFDAARALVGVDKLEVLPGPAVRKAMAGVEVDLSSIAKGAGVDAVSDLLSALGFPSHMVEIGGEVVCRGTKPAGLPWRIGIERPRAGEAGRPIQQAVELRDRAVATSGSYRNFREMGGVLVHHVLDARTGRNAPNGVVSVSVLAPDCALADGLATALMVVGPDEAERVLGAFPGVDLDVLFLMAADEGVVERAFGWPSR